MVDPSPRTLPQVRETLVNAFPLNPQQVTRKQGLKPN